MALKRVGPNYADLAGTSETITIQPVPPQAATQVFFAAATYGLNADGSPHSLPGIAGKQTLTFTLLKDLNQLIFGLAATTAQLQNVNIMQGATLLGTVSVEFLHGVGSLRLMGTSTPAGGN